MSWERALEADARLAARNAVLIRAALRQSFDAERAFIGYQNTMPDENLTLAQQRVRSRAWAIMNIRPNLEPLREVLYRVWAQGYALGDLAAREAIAEAQQAQKADVAGGVDWSKWKPGDATSAILLKPPRAFQRLIEGAGITLKGFSDTTLTDIGNAIGEAIELGLDARTSAKNIMRHVANPARALTIAITEQNRAISTATMNRYLEAGISQQKWLVFDPCKICAQNENVKVSIGAPFPSGHTQTPAHPNCRCALAPVPLSESDNMPGVGSTAVPPQVPTVSIPTPDPQEAIEVAVGVARSPGFVVGAWSLKERSELRQEVIDRIAKLNPSLPRQEIERYVDSPRLNSAERNLIKNGIIYENGPVQVRFYGPGTKIPEAKRKQLLKLVEELQVSNPVGKVAINIGSTSKRKFGWAELGGENMWVTPETILTDTLEKTKPQGAFKMPVLLSNSQRDYTLTHEWGHLIDRNPNPYGRGQSGETTSIISKLKREFPDAFRSGYSGENSKEFFAEMFTEWYLTEGKTENELVQAMAKEFGWGV